MAEPAPNLPTNLNSDLDKTLPDGSQQLVDAPSLPTHITGNLYLKAKGRLDTIMHNKMFYSVLFSI